MVSIAIATIVFSGQVSAQFSNPPLDLSDAIRVDEPAPSVRTQLERVRVNITERQWDEAIEGLRQLMENEGDHLVRVDSRFISLREFCHRELTRLPAEGLGIYRGRVDGQAEQWYQEGVKERNEKLLTQVVDELFGSSYGDSALFALGEMALERGEYSRARECWERISPQLRSADGLPLWITQRSKGESRATGDDPSVGSRDEAAGQAWLAYPDTDLKLADVRARLVLVSILEGSIERARIEYQSFLTLHPNTRGSLAGINDADYGNTLSRLLSAAEDWPKATPPATAATFGGTAHRNALAHGSFALHALAWPAPVVLTPKRREADVGRSLSYGLPQRRVAEDNQALLSFHPLVWNGLVIFQDQKRVFVYNLRSGQPAWPQADKNAPPGVVYPRGAVDDKDSGMAFNRALGVPRFTATIAGSYLFVQLGSQITSWPEASIAEKGGSLVVLDLSQQGKLIAEIKPENDRWSFEGPPVCDGAHFYIAMRYNDVRPQEHVASYEIVPLTGSAGTVFTPRLRWRRMICAAESPARGAEPEITHNLLTFADGALFLNTNLGAVACISAEDGGIKWLTTYPRARGGNNTAHLLRDLNPCVYDRGTLYVAPTDSPQLFAIDAMTGLVRWATPPGPMCDVVHVLGVAAGSLIASGNQLWWLDAETGKFITSFPDPLNVGQVRPFGRGQLIGDVVVWPTREELHVFYQKQSPSNDANKRPAAARDPIRLADYASGLSGGNVVAAGDYTLLATPEKLWAFGPKSTENKVTTAR